MRPACLHTPHPNTHTHIDTERWAQSGEIYFARVPTVTQKHGLIFIVRVIYVYQGPCWVTDPCVGFRLRFPSGPGAPRGPNTVLVIVQIEEKTCHCIEVKQVFWHSFTNFTNFVGNKTAKNINGYSCSYNELICSADAFYSWPSSGH